MKIRRTTFSENIGEYASVSLQAQHLRMQRLKFETNQKDTKFEASLVGSQDPVSKRRGKRVGERQRLNLR